MSMIKHGPINWQFGDEAVFGQQPEVGEDPQPARQPTPHRRRRTWLLIFLVALAASWTTGFYFGRVQQSTAALESELQGQLDVEAWAWKQADWDLFLSLLPPRTPRWRTRDLWTEFHTTAPQNLDLKLVDYVVSQDGTQVEATVQVTRASQQYEVGRTYHLIDGRWWLERLEEIDGSKSALP